MLVSNALYNEGTYNEDTSIFTAEHLYSNFTISQYFSQLCPVWVVQIQITAVMPEQFLFSKKIGNWKFGNPGGNRTHDLLCDRQAP